VRISIREGLGVGYLEELGVRISSREGLRALTARDPDTYKDSIRP